MILLLRRLLGLLDDRARLPPFRSRISLGFTMLNLRKDAGPAAGTSSTRRLLPGPASFDLAENIEQEHGSNTLDFVRNVRLTTRHETPLRVD